MESQWKFRNGLCIKYSFMTIINIEEVHLPACAKILEEGYGRPPYEETFQASTAEEYIRGKYRNCKEHSFVALDADGRVAGFIFLNMSAWGSGPQAVLEEIVVDPQRQGTGIGTALLSFAHTYLASKGVKSAMLWVKKEDRLIKFYERHGYEVAQDFVVMFKNFK